MKASDLISAKEISEKYHITYQTVNHYTNLGLLPLMYKKGNVRFYDATQVSQRLERILQMSSEGYTLRLIRKQLLGV